MTEPAPVRVAVAHPDPLIDAILHRALAHPAVAVIANVGSAQALLDACDAERIDVALVASAFPGTDMAEVIRSVLVSGARILVLASSHVDGSSSRLLLAGASGLLTVDDLSFDSVAPAVLAVASGRTALHPDVAAALLDQWRAMRSGSTEEPASTGSEPVKLTSREADVLRCLAEGLTVRRIGQRLGVAEKTVETHKSRLYSKLGARNQAHAISIASQLGLLAEGEDR